MADITGIETQRGRAATKIIKAPHPIPLPRPRGRGEGEGECPEEKA